MRAYSQTHLALNVNQFRKISFIVKSSSRARVWHEILFFLSVVMKKFPLAKLRSWIAIIKPLFVECRCSARKKVEEGLSRTRRIKLRHFYLKTFLVAHIQESCLKFGLIYFLCTRMRESWRYAADDLNILSRITSEHHFNWDYCCTIRNWSQWLPGEVQCFLKSSH